MSRLPILRDGEATYGRKKKSPDDSQANVSQLKARLSHYLKQVKGGREITVLDRNQPIAKLVPIRAKNKLQTIAPTRDPRDIIKLLENLPPLKCEVEGPDSLQILLEDRRKR